MTQTELILVAIHKAPVVRLSDVCERYLDNTPETARRKAMMHNLPFPVFQMEPGNKKSPWLVRIEDLAEFIDAAARTGLTAWRKSQV